MAISNDLYTKYGTTDYSKLIPDTSGYAFIGGLQKGLSPAITGISSALSSGVASVDNYYANAIKQIEVLKSLGLPGELIQQIGRDLFTKPPEDIVKEQSPLLSLLGYSNVNTPTWVDPIKASLATSGATPAVPTPATPTPTPPTKLTTQSVQPGATNPAAPTTGAAVNTPPVKLDVPMSINPSALGGPLQLSPTLGMGMVNRVHSTPFGAGAFDSLGASVAPPASTVAPEVNLATTGPVTEQFIKSQASQNPTLPSPAPQPPAPVASAPPAPPQASAPSVSTPTAQAPQAGSATTQATPTTSTVVPQNTTTPTPVSGVASQAVAYAKALGLPDNDPYVMSNVAAMQRTGTFSPATLSMDKFMENMEKYADIKKKFAQLPFAGMMAEAEVFAKYGADNIPYNMRPVFFTEAFKAMSPAAREQFIKKAELWKTPEDVKLGLEELRTKSQVALNNTIANQNVVETAGIINDKILDFDPTKNDEHAKAYAKVNGDAEVAFNTKRDQYRREFKEKDMSDGQIKLHGGVKHPITGELVTIDKLTPEIKEHFANISAFARLYQDTWGSKLTSDEAPTDPSNLPGRWESLQTKFINDRVQGFLVAGKAIYANQNLSPEERLKRGLAALATVSPSVANDLMKNLEQLNSSFSPSFAPGFKLTNSVQAAQKNYNIDWTGLINKYAGQYGVPPEIMMGILVKESGGNPQAKNLKGERSYGAWQINLDPSLKRTVTPEQAMDPVYSTNWAANHLAALYKQTGDWKKAIERYNGSGDQARAYADTVWAMIGAGQSPAPGSGSVQPGAKQSSTNYDAIIKTEVGNKGSKDKPKAKLPPVPEKKPQAKSAQGNIPYASTPLQKQVAKLTEDEIRYLEDSLGFSVSAEGDLYRPGLNGSPIKLSNTEVLAALENVMKNREAKKYAAKPASRPTALPTPKPPKPSGTLTAGPRQAPQ